MKKYYRLVIEQTNDALGDYDTREEAEKEMEKLEQEDIEDGNYSAGYYSIIEKEKE